MFKIGVFAIIFDADDRVLFGHRNDYDLWNLPGGGLEPGEAPWEGVVRETKEETGLEVEVERLQGIYNKPDKNEIVFSFICRIKGGELHTTDEADELRYFSISEIPKNTSPKQVERIHDALEHPTVTIFKNHIGPSSIELIKQGKL